MCFSTAHTLGFTPHLFLCFCSLYLSPLSPCPLAHPEISFPSTPPSQHLFSELWSLLCPLACCPCSPRAQCNIPASAEFKLMPSNVPFWIGCKLKLGNSAYPSCSQLVQTAVDISVPSTQAHARSCCSHPYRHSPKAI